ncbi:hypothetical protein PMI14_03209 [Acidovorax sp. CF316]|nr:hypothetical protein PMI14_03209 [Acidovorax sp. CF316]
MHARSSTGAACNAVPANSSALRSHRRLCPSAANLPCPLPCLRRVHSTMSPQPPWMTLWKRPVHAAQSQCRRGLQRGACELTNGRAAGETGPPWTLANSTAGVDDFVDNPCTGTPEPALARPATRCLRIHQPRAAAASKARPQARRWRGVQARTRHPQRPWMTLWKTPEDTPQSQHWRGLRRGACSFISPLPHGGARRSGQFFRPGTGLEKAHPWC